VEVVQLTRPRSWRPPPRPAACCRHLGRHGALLLDRGSRWGDVFADIVDRLRDLPRSAGLRQGRCARL